MGKANFNSNNIYKSKSLAVKIQNSTNIPKGALIRVLPPSKYQTSESRYFTDTHLKYVYKFYKQNGYEQYSSSNDFFSDLEKQNPDCIVKTYLTVYKGLKECSIYPFLKNTDRYIYKSIEEQNFIEEIIEETYYHVFYTLKDKLDVNKVRNLEQLRTYIKMVIKHKAHLDRAIKSFNRTEPVDFSNVKHKTDLGDDNLDNYYIAQETRILIRRVIDNYLRGKDKIDTLIIVNHLMKYGISYGDFTDSRWSLKRIANICGVTERTVQYRKKKIIKELTAIYNKEILPLISD
jgi:hypothetical protein